jgi:hypothetical protein
VKFVIAVALVLAVPAWSDAAATERLPVEQLRQDLHVLRETLEGADAGLYRYTNKAAMDSAFDAVASRLTHPMGELEFYRHVAPLIDLAHDAHNSLALSRPMRWDIAKVAHVFPLNVRYAGERLFVERNAGANRDIPLRGEILAINGHPVPEITPKVLRYRATDGWIRGAKFHAMNRNFWFAYHALVDTSWTFEIAIKDPATGKTKLYLAEGVPADSVVRGQFTTRKRDKFTVEYLENDTVALMSIPTFADTALREKFRDAFNDIKKRNVANLIIDIRDNSGGYDEFNTALLDYLVDHPYRFYGGFSYVVRDTMQLRFTEHSPRDFMGDEDVQRLSPAEWAESYSQHTIPELIDRVNATNRAAGMHEPAKEGAFRGQFYLLVNGGSASSGAEVPALLHFLGVGTIVGEEPNGTYQGVTAGILLNLTLPNSRIRVIVSLIAYHNAVLPGVFEGRGAAPDFELPQTLDDAIAGKDTALDFTLRLIRARAGSEGP